MTLMNKPMAGAGLMLLASSLVAVTTLLAKGLGTGEAALSPFQITWGRFAFALLAISMAMALLRPSLTKPAVSLHGPRIFCGFLGVTCMFTAATLIPLADATAITFLNPVIAMVLAIPILGENVGPIRWSCAIIALLGSLLLIRPGLAGFQPAGLIALLAAILFGFEVIFLKILSGREGAFQIILIANLVGFSVSSIIMLFIWQAPSLEQWGMLAGVGFFMVAAQTCYTNALRLGESSFVLPFTYATLIFATLYDFIFFSVVPEWASVIGAAVIISGAALLAWGEARIKAL